MAGEDKVEGVNNNRLGKNGDVDIVPGSVKMVLARQSIGRSHMLAWGNRPNNVKVLKEERPMGLPVRKFSRVLEI